MWINSLNLDGFYVSDLIEDVKDGILLCKVADNIKPGCINWKKVRFTPKNTYDV